MRKVYKLGLFAIFSLALLFGCKDGDTVFEQIVDNETRGAALRTVELISNELPIGVADAGFSAVLEVQDQENGQLAEFVEVYIGFRDNTVEDGEADGDVPEALFETVNSSEFETGEFGLPRFLYEVSLAEMLTFTGVNEADLLGGDQFEIRFELVLSTGQRFSFDDNTGTLTGSFFSSPFLYTPTVVCPVGEELFVGTYTIETITPGVFGDPVFVETEVELTLGETSTQRIFAATYYVDIGQGTREFNFDFVCGNIIPGGDQAGGLACTGGPGLAIGPPQDGVDPGTYSFPDLDDSVFTIVFTDNVRSDCGGGPVTSEIRLTKQ